MTSAQRLSAAVSAAAVLRVESCTIYAATMHPIIDKARQERRAAVLRIAGGALAFGCFVLAFALWIAGAREAFRTCDADACAAVGTGFAKAVAFDYAKNNPLYIFFGLVFFVAFAGCILGQILQTASCALVKCFCTCFGLCGTNGNTLTVLVVSTLLSAGLVGLYYGAQGDISAECCADRPERAPVAVQASFVLAALPALGVVALSLHEARKQKPPEDLDTMMAMRLLQIS